MGAKLKMMWLTIRYNFMLWMFLIRQPNYFKHDLNERDQGKWTSKMSKFITEVSGNNQNKNVKGVKNEQTK